ncbi:MAG: type II secretion system F family protein [Deltaproteobacteria bacterium]|nr:type II secretion system F family protein [Deltaproteobacteria bacterium]
MATFLCKIGTSDGRVLEKEFESANSTTLKKNLEDQGFYVFQIKKRFFSSFSLPGIFPRRFSERQFLSFNQAMLVLIRSGLPVVQALDAIIERMDVKQLKVIFQDVRNDIKGGTAISGAFGKFPELFPPLYIASLKAGEKTGEIPLVLERHIVYQKKVAEVRQAIRKASFYPLFLFSTALLVFFFLLVFVIPRFSQVYADSQVALPWITRVLVTFSEGLSYALPLVVPGLVVIFLVFRMFLKTERGRLLFDQKRLAFPLVGALFLEYSLGRFCRTLATTINSGIPIVQALEMSSGTLGNMYLETEFQQAIRQVKEGGAIPQVFEKLGMFSSIALSMIAAGEKTGSLSEMLLNVSEYYEMETSRRLDRLSSLFEPLLILFVGVIIGGIIIAMYIPIFQMAGMVR